MTDTITAELLAEHKVCLADTNLRRRAARVLPALKTAYAASKTRTNGYAAATSRAGGSEHHWQKSGGEEAYITELIAERRYYLLTAYVAGKTQIGLVGYFLQDDIEAAIRSA